MPTIGDVEIGTFTQSAAPQLEWVEWATGRKDAEGNEITRERAEAMTKPQLQELSAERAAG